MVTVTNKEGEGHEQEARELFWRHLLCDDRCAAAPGSGLQSQGHSLTQKTSTYPSNRMVQVLLGMCTGAWAQAVPPVWTQLEWP